MPANGILKIKKEVICKMERCVPNGGGRVVHGCGNPRIHVFDNIVQHDPYIAGKTIPVKAEIYPCQETSLSEAGRSGEKAGKEFKKRMFG